MEKIEFSYPATQTLANKALSGVVGSGDLEVLFEPSDQKSLTVTIHTSVNGHKVRWKNLFDRLRALRQLPAGQLKINDFGATPGVVRLRIEQVFENHQPQIVADKETSFIELNARERARNLLDKNTFRELLDPFSFFISPWLEPQGIAVEADDGMVVAKGTFNKKPAVVIAIEGVFQGGSMGEVSGAKMAAALELALEDNKKGTATQVILLLETGGVRLQEANLGLAAIADIHSAINALRHYTPVIGVIVGTVGCFGGMSIAAGLCSYLIMTREARLGLNGPQVIEQEAGIEELDSHDRPLIWSLIGGDIRYRSDFADIEVADSLSEVIKAVNNCLTKGIPVQYRTDNYTYYLNKLTKVDTKQQVTAEQVVQLFTRENKK